jgi:hypothetical protein
MTELFAYRIPDKYFAPHKVVVPFIARVAFDVTDGKVKIFEVALSESAVKYVRTGEQFMNDIRSAIETKVMRNAHVNDTVMSALAPFINH